METGDRVVIVLLDLLLTDGTLPHADADARMMSREILMVLSVALMRLSPLSHKTNEINVSWVPRFLATLLVLCTNLLALFQNQERKTVSIYAKYHVTDPSHDTNMHTSSIYHAFALRVQPLPRYGFGWSPWNDSSRSTLASRSKTT
jgi:hypothetical protein